MISENSEMMVFPSFPQLEVTRDHKNIANIVVNLVKDANCLIVAQIGLLLRIIIVINRWPFVGI